MLLVCFTHSVITFNFLLEFTFKMYVQLALLDDSQAKAIRQFSVDRSAIKKGTNMSLMSYLLSAAECDASSGEGLGPRRRSCFPVDGVGKVSIRGNKSGSGNRAEDDRSREGNILYHSTEVDGTVEDEVELNSLSASCHVASLLLPGASEDIIFEHRAESNSNYVKSNINVMTEAKIEEDIDNSDRLGSPLYGCDKVDGDVGDGSQLSDVDAFDKEALNLTDSLLEAANTKGNEESKWHGVKECPDSNDSGSDDMRYEERLSNHTEMTSNHTEMTSNHTEMTLNHMEMARNKTAMETYSDSSGLAHASIGLQGLILNVIDPASSEPVIVTPQAQGIINEVLMSESNIEGVDCGARALPSSTDIGGLETASGFVDMDCGVSNYSVWNETDQATFVKVNALCQT